MARFPTIPGITGMVREEFIAESHRIARRQQYPRAVRGALRWHTGLSGRRPCRCDADALRDAKTQRSANAKSLLRRQRIVLGSVSQERDDVADRPRDLRLGVSRVQRGFKIATPCSGKPALDPDRLHPPGPGVTALTKRSLTVGLETTGNLCCGRCPRSGRCLSPRLYSPMAALKSQPNNKRFRMGNQ